MKTLKRLLFLIAVISLLISCPGETHILSEPDDLSAVFEIQPSGDVSGVTDFQNINFALHKADTGDVVELGEGLFYLHKSVIRWDFSGTLRGVGKDKTTIQTAPGIAFDVSEDILNEWSDNWTDEGHRMFCFPHHFTTEEMTVIISDLTIVGNEPTTPWGSNVYSPSFTENNSLAAVVVYYIELDKDLANPIHLNVHYKDIAIIGVEDPRFIDPNGTNFSIGTGVGAYGASSGEFVVENVNISNAAAGIVPHVWNGEESAVSITGSKVENANHGIYSTICQSWVVSDNEFKDCSQAGMLFQTYKGAASSPNENAIIEDNQFILEDGHCGILGADMNNVRFCDNTLKGRSSCGIVVKRGDSWEIQDNNLCDLTVSNPEGATIILDYNINSVVRENSGQAVGGSSASDPSNHIGEAKECVNVGD